MKIYGDPNIMFAAVLAGEIDVIPQPTLNVELGAQLKQRWDSTGEGRVLIVPGVTWFLWPQYRPEYQREPGNLDPRVRASLYQAIDRQTLSEAQNFGLKDRRADSIAAPGLPYYEPAKEMMRRFSYDPARSRALLQEVGWQAGPDGSLRNLQDGRRFQTHLRTTPGYTDVPIIADYWKQVGVESEQETLAAALVRDPEIRATFPGWEATGMGPDILLNTIRGPAASPETRWSGNRAGVYHPQVQELTDRFFRTIDESGQHQLITQIAEIVATEVLIAPLYYTAAIIGHHKRVKALDGAGSLYPLAGDAYLWDVMR
jgi:peptide/nickel transport system substrate-binding protein